LVVPSQYVTWPPKEAWYDEYGRAFNAWKIVEGWQPPVVLFSPLEYPTDYFSVGTYDAGWAISFLALDHLNLVHQGQKRDAWVYLVRENGTELLLGQLEVADPAHLTVAVPERGEIQVRTHDSSVWWVRCLAPLSMSVTKIAVPESKYEPGGTFQFSVRVDNTSPVPLTLTQLVDDIYGDVTLASNPKITSTTCSLQARIPSGGNYQCNFQANVFGDPGFSQTDVVTATAKDDLGRTVQASDDATVRILDLPPAIQVVKTPSRSWMQYPGADVTFDFKVTNLSAADTVTINALTDTVYGNLNSQGTCSVPQILTPGKSYACAITVFVSGDPDSTHRNVVTATGIDDDGVPVSAEDDAVVTIAAVPTAVEFLYFTAAVEDDQIVIEWATAWEQDNWGFNLHRGLTSGIGQAEQIHFERAEGTGQFQGQSYEFEDTDVATGQVYHYWLEDVPVTGAGTIQGPIAAFIPHQVFVPMTTSW
jgi:hypothetical protein